jgi:hypothetical protein
MGISLLARRRKDRASTVELNRIVSPCKRTEDLSFKFRSVRLAKNSCHRTYKSTSVDEPLPCTGVKDRSLPRSMTKDSNATPNFSIGLPSDELADLVDDVSRRCTRVGIGNVFVPSVSRGLGGPSTAVAGIPQLSNFSGKALVAYRGTSPIGPISCKSPLALPFPYPF